jgi:hypothetical protein
MPTWFFASLHGYQIRWLPWDIVAGLMLAAIAIRFQALQLPFRKTLSTWRSIPAAKASASRTILKAIA